MPDLASSIELLVPGAAYRGSLTANTQDAYDALIWEDARTKPLYNDVLVADAQVQKDRLKAYAADARWTRQTGGYTYHGVTYSTDFQSPAALSTAYAIATQNPQYSTKWKTMDGNFQSLNTQDIIGLVEGIQAFNDALFSAESQCSSQIDDGTITTQTQITSIINSVPNHL